MTYMNVDEIESALISLAAAYPATCQIITLQNPSIEGRTCHAVRLGTASATEREGVLITGGVHAREWVGPEVCVSLAADLLEAYALGTGLTYGGKSFPSDQVRAVMERLNIFIFADVNPDGRYHSQNIEALWRRNRNPADSGGKPKCIGVDLNRNYDFLWDFPNLFAPSAIVETSTDPCDPYQRYRGSSPSSEPEVRNVVWMMDTYPRIRWFLDIHSYSELILYNWGDDENQSSDPNMNFANSSFDSLRGIDNDTAYREYLPPDDLPIFQALANRMSEAISVVRGRAYTVQQGFSLYATSGAGDDYAYSRHRQNSGKSQVFGFTIECGRSFQPLWSEAENIIREVSAGLLEFCRSAPDVTYPDKSILLMSQIL